VKCALEGSARGLKFGHIDKVIFGTLDLELSGASRGDAGEMCRC
jgi:hypothetical protein